MHMKPPHPGETIKEEYLVPLGMGVSSLARELGIGAARSGPDYATCFRIWHGAEGGI